MSALWKVSTRNLWLAYRVGMTIRRGRGWAAVGALAVVLTTLSGCGTDTPVAIPTQQPTSTPIFASDEEALAAAQEAYAAYQSLGDLILSEGGENPDRIADVSVRSALQSSLESFESFRTGGLHSVGEATAGNISLQSYSPRNELGQDIVSIYLCLDVSKVAVVDSEGNSVVSESRPPLQAFQVFLDQSDTTATNLIVAAREPWGGPGVCE